MKAVLEHIFAGGTLSPAQAQEVLGRILAGEVPAEVTGALLGALRLRGEDPGEIAGFARALRGHMQRIPVDGMALDTCGTGGDGAGTANLSTLAALLLAHLGVPVVKHGNRAATSVCGSADLLEGLGYDLARGPEQLHADLAERRFAFLFAPAYHPLLGRLKEIRKRLGVPTIFNLLGPLLNPARPDFQLLGVAREELAAPMAAALARQGVRRAFVVHGKSAEGRGMDEASTEGPTTVFEIREGRLLPAQVLVPRDLGLAQPARGALGVADRAEALAVAKALGAGASDPAFRAPVADAVALQAGLGLLLHRDEGLDQLPARFAEAREALTAGFAFPLPAKEVTA